MAFHGGRQQDKWQDFGAGFTMGVAMLPALVLVPLMLGEVGMDFAGAYTAAVLSSLVGTLVMGWLHLPIALIPSVAVGGYLVYLLGVSQGLSWQQLLGAGFAASILGVLLVLFPFGRRFKEAVPAVICQLIPGGIGVMLITMGLIQARILIRSPWTLSMLGNFQDPMAYLGLMGILLTLVMLAMQIRGALLYGFVITAILSLTEGFWVIPEAPFMLPEGLDKVVMQWTLVSGSEAEIIHMIVAVLTLLVVWGSMNWSCLRVLPAEVPNKGKSLPVIFAVGAAAAAGGSIPVSASPLSAVGRSCGGVAAGTAWGASLLFALALFCEPIMRSMADFPVMVVPVLVGAGFLLIQQMLAGFGSKPIAWRLPELGAAMGVLLVMPLSGSMAAGLGSSLVGYCLLRSAAGEGKKIPVPTWGLAAVFVFYFVYAAI